MPLSPKVAAMCAVALASVSCSKSRGDSSLDVSNFAAAPLVLEYLDTPKSFSFAARIDAATVTPSSVSIEAVAGAGVGEAVSGSWRVIGDHVEFVPALPDRDPVLTSGGLQPGTTYLVTFAGGNFTNAIRTVDGRWLAESVSATFETRTGANPHDVFSAGVSGPAQLVDVVASPQNAAGEWDLGGTSRPAELRLQFDQPIDPSAANLLRSPSIDERGPIELVYDDAVYGVNTWVAADVELERNAIDGATVVLRPRGVLPSAAELRLSVSNAFRDLSGETRGIGQPADVWLIDTVLALDPQFGALTFAISEDTKFGAADFVETPAVVADGALSIPDAFPTMTGIGDWSPSAGSALLRTDQETLYYQDGSHRTFEGGELHVHDLTIHSGQVVRAHGPNPLVLVVHGDAYIDGALSVSGQDAPAISPGYQYRGPGDFAPPGFAPGNGPLQPVLAGPMAGAAGGRGGAAYSLMPWTLGAAGESAGASTGGLGATLTPPSCGYAGAGGGGGSAMQGDPWFPSPAGPSNLFPQRAGTGGSGCGGTISGGDAGASWFQNTSVVDDFWGRAYVPRDRKAINGELPAPVGGSGGGSGGASDQLGFILDGGHGGGGGGALILKVRGTLTIGPSGRVDADGGHGRGGLHIYSTSHAAGGGGGGAGGMVVLMAGEGIVMHVKGETFANQDYDFAVSADGGICVTHNQYEPYLLSKYPENGEPTITGAAYDSVPMGGFGSMGLVQLMAPIGTENLDGTNTVLDDAITIVRNGVPLQGTEKQRFLGWRGFPNENGVYVDDFGNPTDTIGGQGDIRPDPKLMPVPYASSKARARSVWLPLGAMFRRSLAAPDGLPRGVVGENLAFERHARSDGWLPFGSGGLLPTANTPGVAPLSAAVASILLDHETLGRAAYRVELTQALPLRERDAYAGKLAVLQSSAGGAWARARVIASSAQALFLGVDVDVPTNASAVQVLSWPADLASGDPGIYIGANNQVVPRANVRIGFAFHRDPSAVVTGSDPLRYPADPTTYVYDLSDPSHQAALRAFGPQFIQWDITLDSEFRSQPADQPPPADKESQIRVRKIWLPAKY